MADICVNGNWTTITEPALVGILCSVTAACGSSPPFDVEVSMLHTPTILPISLGRSWTLLKEISKVIEFCENLERKQCRNYIEVVPVGVNFHNWSKKYYFDSDDIDDFIWGFILMNQFILNPPISNKCKLPPSYKNNWTPDINFLKDSVLSATPKDGVNADRIHGLTVPAYIWDIPKISHIYQEQLVVNMIGLFLRDCSQEDHLRLLNKTSYLRFFLYQDEPDFLTHSHPYVNAYIRDIDNCTFDSHIKTLKDIPKDKLPCEVNYSTRGFFWQFSLEEWTKKSIKHIELVD